ncbi:MAG: hypothetical protein LBE24_05205, partial [Methylobacillus sp.]|nr:hypothetical protein [Methylobacillus sp.]
MDARPRGPRRVLFYCNGTACSNVRCRAFYAKRILDKTNWIVHALQTNFRIRGTMMVGHGNLQQFSACAFSHCGAAARRPALLIVLFAASLLTAGLFAPNDAQARCYNLTTLNNGQGNQNPLIRPNAQVDQGANIGYYQPVSGDTIICDNDATPVPGQPGTLLNPLNPVTQVYAASGAPGLYNKIPGYRPTQNVAVHLTDGFLTKERSLPFIHVSYASTVTIDAGATITVGGTSTQDLAWAVGVMHGGSRTIITNNG